MKKSATILLGFLVFLELSCASSDDDGGNGGGNDASVNPDGGSFPDAPRLPDARPLPDGYMLPDGVSFGDGGFGFGDGGFGTPCASNDDCPTAECCIPIPGFNFCVEGARDESLGYCSFK